MVMTITTLISTNKVSQVLQAVRQGCQRIIWMRFKLITPSRRKSILAVTDPVSMEVFWYHSRYCSWKGQ